MGLHITKELLARIAKAGEITTADLAGGGKLNPEQADKFIQFVFDLTALKGNVRLVKPRADTWQIDKIGVGQRVTVPKAEATDPAVRAGVSTSKVTLTPVVTMTPFELSEEFTEISIEGEAVADTVAKMMATQASNDHEGMWLNGDSVGAAIQESELPGGSSSDYVVDSFHKLMDGWLRLADDGNPYDAQGANISANLFSEMLQAMPEKFKKNLANLRFFMSSNLAFQWQERVSSRGTAMGDAALMNDIMNAVKPFGVPIVRVPLMPYYPKVVQHVVLSGETWVSLRYAPVQNETVLPSTLAGTPTAPYVLDTDYAMDEPNGKIRRIATGSIGDGATVKVTYEAYPQVLLTSWQNFILAIGRDVTIRQDFDIFKDVRQWAITMKSDVEFEEDTAIVKAFNIGTGV